MRQHLLHNLSSTTVKPREPVSCDHSNSDIHTSDHTQEILAGQIELLYQQAPAAFWATIFNATVLTLVLWGHVPESWLLVWVTAVCAITFIRFLLVRRYNHTLPPMHKAASWGNLFTAGAFLSGVIWGAAGGLFFLEDSEVHQLILAFILGGMVAGGVSSLSSYKPTYLCFAVPIILPYCYRAISHGGEIYIAIALTYALFLCLLWLVSRQLYRMIGDSFQLRFDNTDLLRHLIHARDQQQAVNQMLQTQVTEKERAQKALQHINDRLEQRIKDRTEALAQSNSILHQEKELFRVTLASIGDAVITTDSLGKIAYLNPTAESLTGWRNIESKGVPLQQVFQTGDIATQTFVKNTFINHSAVTKIYSKNRECILIQKDRQESIINYSVAPIHDGEGEVHGAVLTFRDVTKQRNLARKLAHQAAHDALTGLLNRAEFENRLTKILESTEADNTHALLYLDLDQFKVVNDTCGHGAGDELLRQIAALLQSKLRSRDTLARLGGDEFGIILEHCSQADALQVAQALREAVQDFRYQWQDKSFTVGVSIGLFSIDQGNEKLSKVLSEADSACYVAKDSGRNRVHIYQPDDSELLKRRGEMQWLPRIQKAIEEKRLCLYFQPIVPVSGKDKLDKHGELLLRLRDEQGNIVSPGAFLPSAERYDQMRIIDRWVIEQSFNLIKADLLNQIKGVYAINLSAQALGSEDFLDFLVNSIKTHITDPTCLCFEITENVALADLKSVKRFISTLKELGCLFSMDDFGSGLSSFGYLKDIPIDYLKIDGRLVKDMAIDPVDQAMVRSIQSIGRVMGLKMIAEWVETADTVRLLEEMKVDYMQGFLPGKPYPLWPCNAGLKE